MPEYRIERFLKETYTDVSKDTIEWFYSVIEDAVSGVDLYLESSSLAFKGSIEQCKDEYGEELFQTIIERKEFVSGFADKEKKKILYLLVVFYFEGDYYEEYDDYKKAVIENLEKDINMQYYLENAHTDAVRGFGDLMIFIQTCKEEKDYFSGVLFR